eukprot:NODE_789_length_1777_cov_14.328125_g644_i0.p1 GENE.NODE_789_length_1777_cov_14.328125_g644_i0~~NODE_789_length_1777_cov_14.328125_g644_i0.p1  ORF type:complete len:509 (-),score=49.42 NODE_789_length_1777_cov_14.328125_g644_i0:41-1567(-)
MKPEAQTRTASTPLLRDSPPPSGSYRATTSSSSSSSTYQTAPVMALAGSSSQTPDMEDSTVAYARRSLEGRRGSTSSFHSGRSPREEEPPRRSGTFFSSFSSFHAPRADVEEGLSRQPSQGVTGRGALSALRAVGEAVLPVGVGGGSSREEAEPSRNAETFFCPIDLCRHDITEGYVVPECDHRFCQRCIASLLRSAVEDSVVDVRCPNIDEETDEICENYLPRDAVEQFLVRKGLTDTLAKFRKWRTMRESPDTRSCPKCEHRQGGGSKESPQMTCEKCGQQYCYNHATAHDPEKSCGDFEKEMTKKEKASVEHIDSTCKPCPKCGRQTYKSSGCNHMTCPAPCRTDWCWLCGTLIPDGHKGFPEHFADGNMQSSCRGKQFVATPGEETTTLTVPPCLIWTFRVLTFPIWLPCLIVAILLWLLGWIFCLPFYFCIDSAEEATTWRQHWLGCPGAINAVLAMTRVMAHIIIVTLFLLLLPVILFVICLIIPMIACCLCCCIACRQSNS